jgi:hypothetical protein
MTTAGQSVILMDCCTRPTTSVTSVQVASFIAASSRSRMPFPSADGERAVRVLPARGLLHGMRLLASRVVTTQV